MTHKHTQKCLQALGDPQQHSNQQTVWLQTSMLRRWKSSFCLHQLHVFKHYSRENKRSTFEATSFDLQNDIFQTHSLESLWITTIRTDDVIWKTHLQGLSPPTGDVAVLQLLRPPSSLSFIFLRSGGGRYTLWLLLLGRYWLKGRGVRSSVTEVRRTDMSSLRTSGIFLWRGPSDSESLPRPGGEAKNTAIIRIRKDLYCVGWGKMQTHFNNMLAHNTNFQQKVSQAY